jgi:hypothetical protein
MTSALQRIWTESAINSRKAKEVMVVERLMRFRPHEALIALARETQKQSAYAVLESQARLFAGRQPRRFFPLMGEQTAYKGRSFVQILAAVSCTALSELYSGTFRRLAMPGREAGVIHGILWSEKTSSPLAAYDKILKNSARRTVCIFWKYSLPASDAFRPSHPCCCSCVMG